MSSPANVACLQSINFSLLKSGEASEISRLLQACQINGFFYLNLEDDAHGFLLDLAKALALLMGFYDEPLDIKLRSYKGEGMAGYKPIGTHAGFVEGKGDGYENFRVPKDDLFADTTTFPKQIHENKELFVRLVTTAHSIMTVILSALSDSLGVSGPDRFENKHRLHAPARAELQFLKYAKQTVNGPNVGFGKHTDIGTLNLLLFDDYGLQVLCPEHSSWEYVQPKKHQAVVNVGDTLHALSHQQLRSVVHRVKPVKENQDRCRFSTGYFLRAENQTPIRDSNGEQRTALQYYERKFKVYQEPHEVQKLTSIITGGMEKMFNVIQGDQTS